MSHAPYSERAPSIEGISIDSDEDGFHLYLDGDFVTLAEEYVAEDESHGLHFRLPQDVAWALVDQMRPVNEWRREGEIAKAQYDGFVRAGLKFENGEWVPDEDE